MRKDGLLFAAATLLAAAVAAPVGLGAPPLERHAVAGYRMSIAVPSTWVAVALRDALTPGYLERLKRENPAVAPFFSAIGQRNSPVKFIAVDPRVRQAFATNVNVVVTAVPGSITFATYAVALTRQLRSLPNVVGAVDTSTASLPGGRALRVKYRLKLVLNGVQRTLSTLQYCFLRFGRSYVVTYSTLPSLDGAYAATFTASARSIRFT